MEGMQEKKSYERLEHTADAYLAAYGKDLAEAFESAAAGMFNVMTQVEKVRPQIEDEVEVRGDDEYALLYNWLEALLLRFDLKGMLYSKFKVEQLSQDSNGFVLKAALWGERFDPKRHLQKVGIKAVTYHRMEIIAAPGKVTLKFLLDI
jgi:SHS2 domain-containing protein